jgi:exopolysaccharide production protein ExoQ
MRADGDFMRSAVSSFRTSTEARGAEKAFVVLVLLLSLGAFQNLAVTGPIETQNMGMLGMQILWSFLYVVILVLYSRNCNRPLRTLFVVSPLIAVLAFAFASVSWSQDPALTFRRSIALTLSLVFGVYLASRFSKKEQFRLLAWAFAVCIIFSFIFELLGLNPSEGSPGWYGVFDIKNELGQAMVLSAMVFLFWKKVEPEHRALATAGFIASVTLLALSLAMTAIVVFAVLMVLLPYLQWTLRKSTRGMVAGIAFLLAAGTLSALYTVTHLEEVTGFLGKDPALTGRMPLWIVAGVMALQRPWLGYGFNAFWLPDETYTPRIWHLLTWMPPQAHNGVLELWLELGLVGTGLFLLVFAYYVARALRFSRHYSGPAAAWPVAFLIFLFLGNLTTAFFLQGNNIYFILYVTLAATMYTKGSKTSVANGLAIPRQNYA